MNMFIGNYENNVLPFYLARNGYDVYLSNFRGTSYTLDHLKLSHRDANFWEFSFHEMAHEDLPAIFDHITNITHDSNNNSTRNKINVVPLSMGGGILLLSLAARIPSVVNNVGKILLISPIMFMKNDQNLLLQFLNVTNIV
jgi:lysosomal acid lipase/cholesteryl ester hydrolase